MSSNNCGYYHNLVFTGFAVMLFAISGFTQSGGQFTIEQSVVANSGGASSGGTFSVAGTNAQSIAGTSSTNSPFGLHGGFWNAPPMLPTAALVSISGRILTASGQGIRNVTVTVADKTGVLQTGTTGSLGYYRFEGITAGGSLIISVSAKRFAFAQPTIMLNVADDVSGLDFVALE